MSSYPFIASLLRIAGGFGFVLHILSVVLVIIVRPIWVGAISDAAIQVVGEVEEIETLLSLTEESLSLASGSLNDTSDLLLETGEFIQDSNVLLRSIGKVIGEEAPKTIESTHNAIKAAQSGSKAVDTMLRGLSILEPVTGFSYEPEKDLSQSLTEVSEGLEPLPENLRQVQRQLNQAADALDGVHPGVDTVAQDLTRFSENIAGLSTQIASQGETLNLIQNNSENFLEGVAAFGRISTIILCVFLILGAVSYLSVYLVGSQMRSG